LIEQRLKEFKVPVTVLGANAGPVITRFEIEPALGVRGAQIVNLMKDLSRALGLTSIRVVETIPGKTCMGLELPNPRRQMIRLAVIVSFLMPTPVRSSMLTLGHGQGHYRRAGGHRPRAGAPHAGGRHHRVRQIGGDQCHRSCRCCTRRRRKKSG